MDLRRGGRKKDPMEVAARAGFDMLKGENKAA